MTDDKRTEPNAAVDKDTIKQLVVELVELREKYQGVSVEQVRELLDELKEIRRKHGLTRENTTKREDIT